MTVNELIKKLKEFDGNAPVVHRLALLLAEEVVEVKESTLITELKEEVKVVSLRGERSNISKWWEEDIGINVVAEPGTE